MKIIVEHNTINDLTRGDFFVLECDSKSYFIRGGIHSCGKISAINLEDGYTFLFRTDEKVIRKNAYIVIEDRYLGDTSNGVDKFIL
jgi:hypothetical protein